MTRDITVEEHNELLKSLDNAEQRTQEGIITDSPDASGVFTAFLSGMTNDESYKIRWLAEKRFPALVEAGIDPMHFYFVDGDGDISYIDPNDNQAKKEFEEFLGLDVADYFDKLGPTGQFLSEVSGGLAGLTSGFLSDGLSGAILGGARGTAKGGAISYAARAGISQAFGGPPLRVGKAAEDLGLSTLFGALPIGVPSSAIPKAFRGIYEKFPGVEGREALQDVILNGGKTVDDKIAYFKEKYPEVVVTRAEADATVGSRGAQLQQWLLKQPQNQKLLEFYQDRNLRIRKIAEDFFDEVLSGKYVDDASKNKLSGKAAGDVDLDVGEALQSYIKKQKEQLQKQVKPLYDQAYDIDLKIDIEDVLADVRKILNNPNTSPEKLAIYKRVEKALVDGNTGKARNSTELIHQGLSDDFRRIFASLSSDQRDAPLKREITVIRDKIQTRLTELNPSYKDATKIYNEATGVSQQLEKSIAGQFARVVEQGGSRAAALSKKFFSGNIKPDEITQLKNILKEEDPQTWQNLKGIWLASRWDDVLVQSKNPLGEPNKFLAAIGIKSPEAAFPAGMPARLRSRAKLQEDFARGRMAKMWEAIFEPDELAAFIDLTDIMQAVGKLQTAGGSDTFSNFAIDNIVTQGSKVVLGSPTPVQAGISSFFHVVDGALGVIPRLLNKGTDISGYLSQGQKDAYIDLLISHIVDPTKRVVLQEAVKQVTPNVYRLTQVFSRSGLEGIKELSDYLDGVDEIEEEKINPSFGPLQKNEEIDVENLQSQLNDFEMPMADQDLFQTEPSELTTMEMASPTILPDERDREIAMRRQAGIAGLV